jgi:EmrB/QacA subfamily drug resistance transporter
MLIGTLFGTFANSMMSIALPSIIDDFGTPLSLTVLAITLYTLTLAVFMPVFGSLGSILGFKRLFLAGMLVFTAASLFAGLSRTFAWLLVWRVLQGFGSSTVLPTIMAVVAYLFDKKQRGRAIGFWALANGAGHALGPFIGGFLVQNLGWNSIFLIQVPFCLLCILLVWRLLPDDGKESHQTFDVMGAVFLTGFAFSLMFAMNQAGRLGWDSPLSLALWASAITFFILFILREKWTSLPFVDLSLFKNLRYSAAIAVVSIDSLTLFGLLIILPVFLIRILGYETQVAGIILLSLTLVMALLGPPAGYLSDRLGSRKVCVMGLTMVAAGVLFLLLLYRTYSLEITWWNILAGLIMAGAGLGLIQSPSTAAVIQVVDPEKVGISTGIFHMVRFMMGSLGSLAFGLVLDLAPGGMSAGFQTSLLVMFLIAILGSLIAFKLPGRPMPTHEPLGLTGSV